MHQNGGALKFDLSKVIKHFLKKKKKKKKIESFMEEYCEIRINDNIPSIFSNRQSQAQWRNKGSLRPEVHFGC